MRPFLALPLFLAACGGASEAPDVNTVDINAAAVAAQDSIEGYAANSRAPQAAATGAPATSPIVMPSPAPTQGAGTGDETGGGDESLTPSAPGTPGGLPDDRTPISEASFKPDSAQGAAQVVETYYALIGERKYARAWALWGHGGTDSGMSAAAFAASFDKYRDYRANIGAPGDVDAGMSQRWVIVPVQVYGRLKTGGQFNMRGTITLHRIVPGVSSDAADEKWHIRTADIKPRPAG